MGVSPYGHRTKPLRGRKAAPPPFVRSPCWAAAALAGHAYDSSERDAHAERPSNPGLEDTMTELRERIIRAMQVRDLCVDPAELRPLHRPADPPLPTTPRPVQPAGGRGLPPPPDERSRVPELERSFGDLRASVHPTLSSPRPAAWLRPDPPLRVPRQPLHGYRSLTMPRAPRGTGT